MTITRTVITIIVMRTLAITRTFTKTVTAMITITITVKKKDSSRTIIKSLWLQLLV